VFATMTLDVTAGVLCPRTPSGRFWDSFRIADNPQVGFLMTTSAFSGTDSHNLLDRCRKS
jgi:hypothetical protein